MRVKALNLADLQDNPLKNSPPPPPDKGGEGSPGDTSDQNQSSPSAGQQQDNVNHTNQVNNINSCSQSTQSTQSNNQNTDNRGNQSTCSAHVALSNGNNQNQNGGGKEEKADESGEYGHALIPLVPALGGGNKEVQIEYKVESVAVCEAEKSGEFNTIESFQIHFSRLSDFAKKTLFWDILSRLATDEDFLDTDAVTDILRFNGRMAIKRLIWRRMPNYCYTYREKREIIMILDDSGSMDWWAENVMKLAELAVDKEDIEVYLAPNGELVKKLDRRKKDYVVVEHDKEIKRIQGFTVLYVGDFDGRGGVCQLSTRNTVIWLCPEFRDKEPYQNDMAGDECPLKYRRQFNGVFIRVRELAEVFYYLARLPSPLPVHLVLDRYFPL